MKSKTQLVTPITEFGWSIFHHSVTSEAEDNFVFSPLVLHNALTMLWAGMTGDTRDEFQKALCFHKVSDVHEATKSLMDKISNNENPKVLTSSNNIFVRKGLDPKADYTNMIHKYYDTVPQLIDFEGRMPAKEINNWVQSHTNHAFRGFVRSNNLSPMTELLVVSAAVFRSEWAMPFPIDRSCYQDFHISGNQVCSIEMMSSKGMYSVGEDSTLRCSVLEIPYSGDAYSLVILLPNDHGGIEHVQHSLTNVHLASLPKPTPKRMAEISLPKFKLESKIPVKKLLSHLGADKMFDNRLANLLGIVDAKRIHVNDVLHKVQIDIKTSPSELEGLVDHNSTKRSERDSDSTNVVVNRPFVFFVKHSVTNCVVILGRFSMPEQAKHSANIVISPKEVDVGLIDVSIPASTENATGTIGYVNMASPNTSGYVNVTADGPPNQLGSCKDLSPAAVGVDGYLKPVSFHQQTETERANVPAPVFDHRDSGGTGIPAPPPRPTATRRPSVEKFETPYTGRSLVKKPGDLEDITQSTSAIPTLPQRKQKKKGFCSCFSGNGDD